MALSLTYNIAVSGFSLTLPIFGGTVTQVNWGDGHIDNTDVRTHTYTSSGIYTVLVSGSGITNFDYRSSNGSTGSQYLTQCNSFGGIGLTNLSYAFLNATILTVVPSALPTTSIVTNMLQMFYGAILFNQDISGWVTTNVTNMSQMFRTATAFNQDISSWDVSNVTNMSQMFQNATAFNQPLAWANTNKVTNMVSMFSNATAFNQDISGWDVSNVTSMNQMFQNATAFNQPLAWANTNKVTNMVSMFSNATAFNQDISGWDVSNVTSMNQMFQNATAFNQSVAWANTNKVTSMVSMFSNATAFNQDISGWVTTSVTNMSSIFYSATAFNQNISGWDTSSVTSMGSMFYNAIVFNQDISGWDVSSITNMSSMLDYSAMSIDNYNLLLSGWSLLTLQPNVLFGVSGLIYTSAGVSGYSILTSSPNNWIIIGDAFQQPDIITQNESFSLTYNDINLVDGNTYQLFYDSSPFSSTITYSGTSGQLDFTSLISSVSGVITVQLNDNTDIFTLTTFYISITTAPLSLTYDITIPGFELILPISGIGSTITQVDWGDGSTPDTLTTHIYTSSGTYTVLVSGTGITDLNSAIGTGVQYLTRCDSFGEIGLTNLSYAFYSAYNLTIVPSTLPTTSIVTNMLGMFQSASVFNGDISGWDVSNVTSMVSMFSNATAFNQDISSWDVSNVTNMGEMFLFNPSFNKDISSWDVSNVINMRSMFYTATAFNKDISSWDVSNVTDMGYMFYDSSSFNQDISSWDVSSVTNMDHMFYNAISFNNNSQALTWGSTTINVVYMSNMFSGAGSFNQDISSWDVSNVIDMSFMFQNAIAFNQDISSWDVSSVITMRQMFQSTNSFNQNISSWDVSSVITMRLMFYENISFNGDISSWNMSSVTDLRFMFFSATSFNKNISGWDVSSVTNMSSMFQSAIAFNQDISSWDVSNVTIMTNMLVNTAMSIDNYNLLLSGWSLLSLQPNVTFGVSGLIYTSSGISGYSILTSSPNNWIIIGDAFQQPDTIIQNDPFSLTYNDINLINGHIYQLFYDLLPFSSTITYSGTGNQLDFTNLTSSVSGVITVQLNDNTYSSTLTTFYITVSSQPQTLSLTYDITIPGFELILPISGIGSTVTQVDWGDGSTPDTLTTHTYTSSGTYTVLVSGTGITDFDYRSGTGSGYLTACDSFGEIGLTNLSYAFYNALNLTVVPSALPTETLITNMLGMFSGATSFNGDISSWDVSNVTDMSSMFQNAYVFNQNISSWDVSNVLDMSNMFEIATAFNQNIGGWGIKTSNVTSMSNMFYNTTVFNGNISGWDTSSVTDMSSMFQYATAFNKNIGSWDVSSVIDMSSMFSNATAFNQNIGSWDVSSVEQMPLMFQSATSFNQNIGSWDVSSVTDMSAMFDLSRLSTHNYNLLLSGWSMRTLQSSVIFGVLGLIYTSAGLSGRNKLVSTYNWIINGDGFQQPDTILVNSPFRLSYNDNSLNIGNTYQLFYNSLPLSSPITYDGTNAPLSFTNLILKVSGIILIQLIDITSSYTLRSSNTFNDNYTLPSGYYTLATFYINVSTIPISNICFPAYTPIETDQGIININNIDPLIHTISNKKIVAITKTITPDNYLVSFGKSSLGHNMPSEKTVISKDHKIKYDGKMIEAYKFIGNFKNVKEICYNKEILYNILMETYDTVIINNLVCETLHPKNIIAKLFNGDIDEHNRNLTIFIMNVSINKKDHKSYKQITNTLKNIL